MSTGWLVVIALAALAMLSLAWWSLRWLRRRICLRRADCCGRGCGCVFPRKVG